METRKLGNTDLTFTTIGIGTWAIGGGDWLFGWGQQDADDSVAAMKRAVELGVNWIDTAPLYGMGESEKVVGRLLKDLPSSERPLIATKFGRYEQPDKTIAGCLKREAVFAECESSLKNLGVDCIDLYQMHWPDPDADIEEGWEAAVELVKQGKVRHIGVSNQTVAQMQRLIAIHPIASLQPPYNMLQREIEDEVLPFCEANQIGVVGYSPLGKGLLTGAFSLQRAKRLPDNDHRSRDPKFLSPQIEINLNLVDAIRSVAQNHDRHLAQLAIAWCLRNPVVTAAIVGVRRPNQIEQTIAAGNWKLSESELQIIDQALNGRREELNSAGV